jgi:hypothetical protein
MCMDYNMSQIYIGDKMGRIHLIDASDVKFDLIKVRSGAWGGPTESDSIAPI